MHRASNSLIYINIVSHGEVYVISNNPLPLINYYHAAEGEKMQPKKRTPIPLIPAANSSEASNR